MAGYIPSLQDQEMFVNSAYAAGQIISGFGAYENNQQKAAAEDYNATIAGKNADIVGAETASNAQQLAYKQALAAGEQRAAIGESGSGGMTGSNLRFVQQSEIQNHMNLLNQQFAGTVKRYSLLDQQTLDNYSAKVDRSNASTDLFNMGISTTSTLLRGANSYLNSEGS